MTFSSELFRASAVTLCLFAGTGCGASTPGATAEVDDGQANAEGASSTDASFSDTAQVDAAEADGTDANAAEADANVDCTALDWGVGSCNSCVAQNCCSIESLCLALPTCVPLYDCWEACDGGASCQMACGTQYIDAISNYNAILNCKHNNCSMVCTE